MAGVIAERTGRRYVLALNCGSSSLKFGLYECDESKTLPVCEGEAEEIGAARSSFWFKASGTADKHGEKTPLADHQAALAHAIDVLRRCEAPQPTAVGHRFVHGGTALRAHQRVTTGVIDQLRAAIDYAPLHVPAALAVLEAVQKKLPTTPQVLCLDTAFHSGMPDVSKTLPLPDDIRRLGVERYGFHGISLESILAQMDPVPERLIVAHLGNGASVTAIRAGKSIDNTMGFTPTGGVMMGTRSGDLDPGAMIYIARHGRGSPQELEQIFDHRSGLLGVSGITSDVRELQSVRKHDARADLALRMFCYQVRKAIAAMAAALGGLDALVFTGGIGEHAVEVRNEIRLGLDFLGNYQTFVLPSQEDQQIARITAQIIDGSTSSRESDAEQN